MKHIFKILLLLILIGFTSFLSGCGNEDPVKEDIPELITKVILEFTPISGGSAIVISATDPDGNGAQNLKVDGPINLTAGVSYQLRLQLYNELFNPNDAEYNVREQIVKEATEHQFYYSWTDGLFMDPTGNGNIDNRVDKVNYDDSESNGLPIGLITSWKAASTTQSGKSFRIVLKHQPELKSATSTFNDGETDLDIAFTINVN